MTQNNNSMINIICSNDDKSLSSRIQQSQISIPRVGLSNSKFYNDLINDCNCDTVYFPEQYVSCYDNYVCYLTDQDMKTVSIEDVKLCHYLEDNVYLELLVTKLLQTYMHPDNSKRLHTLINTLNVNNQRDVYLHFPYYWLPETIICDSNFRQEWSKLNISKQITIGNTTYFHTITYYKSGLIQEIKPYCYLLIHTDKTIIKAKHWSHLYKKKDIPLLHGMVRSWSDGTNVLSSQQMYHLDKKYAILSSSNQN